MLLRDGLISLMASALCKRAAGLWGAQEAFLVVLRSVSWSDTHSDHTAHPVAAGLFLRGSSPALFLFQDTLLDPYLSTDLFSLGVGTFLGGLMSKLEPPSS